MPKLRHQILVELFRDQPKLSLQLLERLGYPVPKGMRLRVVDSDLSTSQIVERHADLVTLGIKRGHAQLAVITEVQLRSERTHRDSGFACVQSAAWQSRSGILRSDPAGSRADTQGGARAFG